MVHIQTHQGSAYVVQNNFTGQCFAAKKMNIDGMPESEIEAAKGEVRLLLARFRSLKNSVTPKCTPLSSSTSSAFSSIKLWSSSWSSASVTFPWLSWRSGHFLEGCKEKRGFTRRRRNFGLVCHAGHGHLVPALQEYPPPRFEIRQHFPYIQQIYQNRRLRNFQSFRLNFC